MGEETLQVETKTNWKLGCFPEKYRQINLLWKRLSRRFDNFSISIIYFKFKGVLIQYMKYKKKTFIELVTIQLVRRCILVLGCSWWVYYLPPFKINRGHWRPQRAAIILPTLTWKRHLRQSCDGGCQVNFVNIKGWIVEFYRKGAFIKNV